MFRSPERRCNQDRTHGEQQVIVAIGMIYYVILEIYRGIIVNAEKHTNIGLSISSSVLRSRASYSHTHGPAGTRLVSECQHTRISNGPS